MTDLVGSGVCQARGMERIRLVEREDAEVLAGLLAENREFLKPWEPERSAEYLAPAGQLAEIEGLLMLCLRGEAMPFVILDDEGRVAGRLTLSGIVRGSFQSCNLGYWLAQDQTGKGFATQAVGEAVAHAFEQLGLHRIQAGTLLHNHASQGVLARNGFEQFGLAPRYLEIAGAWQDHVLFQRLNEE